MVLSIHELLNVAYARRNKNGFTSSPAVGTAITLELPSALQSAVVDMVSNRFDVHYGEDIRRGVRSERTGDYQITYASDAESAQMGMTKEIEEVLTQFAKPNYF